MIYWVIIDDEVMGAWRVPDDVHNSDKYCFEGTRFEKGNFNT